MNSMRSMMSVLSTLTTPPKWYASLTEYLIDEDAVLPALPPRDVQQFRRNPNRFATPGRACKKPKRIREIRLPWRCRFGRGQRWNIMLRPAPNETPPARHELPRRTGRPVLLADADADRRRRRSAGDSAGASACAPAGLTGWLRGPAPLPAARGRGRRVHGWKQRPPPARRNAEGGARDRKYARHANVQRRDAAL
jgi:hypothetical protein